jgi:CheY-like chemotaxis protein/methyl-accepting chemotaxis protein
MLLFKNISIRTKLMLATLVPLLGLLYYVQLNIGREQEKQRLARKVLSDVVVIQEISKLIHEVQRERALTHAYVQSAEMDREELNNQREFTDKAVASLNRILLTNDVAIDGYSNIDSLARFRVKANSKTRLEIVDPFYSGLKANLIDGVTTIIRSSDNTKLKNRFDEHVSLLYMKDGLAQLRSSLAGAIAVDKFTGNAYGKFAAIFGQYSQNKTNFENIASEELGDFYRKKYEQSFQQQTNNFILRVFNDGPESRIPIDFNSWWDMSSTSINALKEVEDYSSYRIGEIAREDLSSSSQNLVATVVSACVILAIIVLIVFFTIRHIVSAISNIKMAADRLAVGEINVGLSINANDEIGKLAKSFSQMIDNTRAFSESADRIGKGDYGVSITPRGESDILGNALERMRNNLQTLSKENGIRTWLLTGGSELNDVMRGEKNITALAQDVITHVSKYLKAQVGAIYLQENGRLELTGSYAYHHRKDNTNLIKPGEGLVGQAALEKKPIIFNDIPEDYIRIKSALGNTVPKNILVFPFLYEDTVKGVIELGCTQPISDLDIQFLEIAGNNIGIAFNASQSRSELKELLEETQRQAEELEVQQEELKQANEELIEKTSLLEKSEAELKTQQEELQQTNEELEEKANLLEEQKERLETAKMDIENKARELEATSKYKSEFLANMSHELRTPLNSILILAQLLSENKNNKLGDKEVDFVKNIYSSGTDLLNLINEILDLSKVESGKMELELTEVSFDSLADRLHGMFSQVAANKGITFDIAINKTHLAHQSITTDGLRLEQILRNLLSNAFKFTDRGGVVTMTFDAAPKRVALTNEKLKNKSLVAIRITDTGIGIPEHKQSIVFEAFQQADGSTKRKYGGTGLGLSICRELAIALGGEIQLESEVDKGSSFTLFLPFNISTNSSDAVREPATPEKVEKVNSVLEDIPQETVSAEVVADDRYNLSENDKVVLIIEDDRSFANLLLDFVRQRNYKGVIAYQGNTGLSYARLYRPDAIILDMKLPVMDGSEVLNHLKRDPALRHLPVQIISGYDLRKEGIDAGAFDFVKKPVSVEALQHAFEKIEDFINKKLKKLLIVEDNEMQNKAIKELIGNGDVKSFSAYSGTEAIEMLKKEKFDCIIVDLGLPDMLGFDLLKRIKSDEDFNKIPIVVYTGKDLTKEESALLNKLASTVVLKTVHSMERLLDETTLFLHRVESRLPKEKQSIIRKLHKTDEVLRGKTILVVDDDIRNIYSLTNALAEEGLNCLVAENGKTAIQMLKEADHVDLVLMDVMMPEMDGYEATKAIRGLNKFQKLPIIALTAKAMKGDREKCLLAGMSDYIAKPVNIEQLLSLMRVWLYR